MARRHVFAFTVLISSYLFYAGYVWFLADWRVKAPVVILALIQVLQLFVVNWMWNSKFDAISGDPRLFNLWNEASRKPPGIEVETSAKNTSDPV